MTADAPPNGKASAPSLRARAAETAVFAGIVMLVVPLGAVEPVVRALVALPVALLFGLALVLAPPRPALRSPAYLALGVMLLLCGWAFLQTLPIPFLGHPAWAELHDLSGASALATLSVDPDTTRRALSGLALPFLVFVLCLLVFHDDGAASRLLRFLAGLTVAVAIWSILEHAISPETVLMLDKRAHQDSLTGTFRNRNTAATFFGLGILLFLARLAVETAREPVWPALRLGLYREVYARRGGRRLLALLATLAVLFLALALTRSRAGLAATLAALALYLAMERPAWLLALWSGRMRWRIAKSLLAFAGLVGFVVFFASRTVFRASSEGLGDVSRDCIFDATFAMLRDHWLLGGGFGSFAALYPAYRGNGCPDIWYTVDRAHNVFLEGWTGFGLPFVLACILGYVVLVQIFRQGLARRKVLRPWARAGFAILLLVTLHSLVDFSLQIPGFAAPFAAAMAGLVVISRNGRGPMPD